MQGPRREGPRAEAGVLPEARGAGPPLDDAGGPGIDGSRDPLQPALVLPPVRTGAPGPDGAPARSGGRGRAPVRLEAGDWSAHGLVHPGADLELLGAVRPDREPDPSARARVGWLPGEGDGAGHALGGRPARAPRWSTSPK